jgi:O-antigen/teichoic acid export membrane protein
MCGAIRRSLQEWTHAHPAKLRSASKNHATAWSAVAGDAAADLKAFTRTPPPPPRLLASSQWHLLGFGAALLGNLAAIPLVIRWIGIDAFGSAGLVVAICAPLSFIGGSVAQALIREMSPRLHAGDAHGAWRHAHAAIRMVGLASLALLAAIVLIGPSLGGLLTRATESAPPGVELYIAAGTGWFAQQWILILQATMVASQEFRRVATANAATALLTLVATLAVTACVPTATGYLWSLSVGFWTSAAYWCFTLRAHLLRSPGGSLAVEIRSLLHFARWQIVTQLAGSLSNQIDRYMLGATAPVAVVGSYNVAKRLQESASIGVLKVGEVLFPRFGTLADAPTDHQAQLYLRATWALTMFSAALLAPIAGLAHDTLQIWVAPSANPDGETILVSLALAALIGSGSTVHFAHDLGGGRQRMVAAISVFHSTVTLVLTTILIASLGPVAAGGGLLCASALRMVTTLWLARRTLGNSAPWRLLLSSNVIPIVTGIAVALAVRWIQPTWIDGWPTLMLAGALVSAVTLLVATILTWALPLSRSLVRDAGHAIRT